MQKAEEAQDTRVSLLEAPPVSGTGELLQLVPSKVNRLLVASAAMQKPALGQLSDTKYVVSQVDDISTSAAGSTSCGALHELPSYTRACPDWSIITQCVSVGQSTAAGTPDGEVTDVVSNCPGGEGTTTAAVGEARIDAAITASTRPTTASAQRRVGAPRINQTTEHSQATHSSFR